MNEKKNKKLRGDSGQITVFLSLILVLVLSLIFTVIETVRVQTVKGMISNIMDMGLDSLLAEYDKELLETYDLFFIDATYESRSFSKNNIKERLEDYMSYNYEPDKDFTYMGNTDLWRMSPNEIKIHSIARASDYEGQVLKDQAVSYIKSKVGLDRLVDIRNLLSSSPISNIGEDFFENKWESNKEDIRREKESIEDTEIKESIQMSLIDSISRMKNKSILTLAVEDSYTLSNKQITLSDIPSLRMFPQEEAELKVEEDLSETLVEIMYGEYILEKFSSYVNSKDSDILEYQIEYILTGKKTDYENLEGVVNKILLIREGINFSYLIMDSQKRQEAYNMAFALVGYTGSLPLVTAVQMSLLLSWAFGESVMEVRALLSGEKVSFLKNKENWKLQLSNLGNLKEYTHGNHQSENQSGLSYEDYLRIFLFVDNKSDKNRRVMDMIELTLKHIKGDEDIRIEHLISSIQVSGFWKVDSLFLTFPFLKDMKHTNREYFYELEMIDAY